MPAALLLALLSATPAGAHGLWGHIHVTGWAVENMPDDDLRAFLTDEPEVFNALLFGAVFADTGYARDDPASRAYSEHAHWEPFVEDYVEWVRANDPPPWDSLESRKRVAFLMGCASHGLQDSIFDSLFLHQVEERDGAGQGETDPGTDGFLVLDDHIRFVPEREIPMNTVLELMEVVPEEITEDVIDASVTLTTAAYINGEIGLTAARVLGEQNEPLMPWGRDHYLNPDVPGSLRAEVFPTMRYQQAIWARLHGELDADAVTAWTYPDPARRLRSGESDTVDSWLSLVFGAGVVYEDGLVELFDDAGEKVPATQGNTRWGAAETRLIRLYPDADLTPGGWYTLRLRDAVELVDGRTSTKPSEHRFQVACSDPEDPACPPVFPPVARIDGSLPEPLVEEASGCGCASGAGPGWLWLLLAAVVRFRHE